MWLSFEAYQTWGWGQQRIFKVEKSIMDQPRYRPALKNWLRGTDDIFDIENNKINHCVKFFLKKRRRSTENRDTKKLETSTTNTSPYMVIKNFVVTKKKSSNLLRQHISDLYCQPTFQSSFVTLTFSKRRSREVGRKIYFLLISRSL